MTQELPPKPRIDLLELAHGKKDAAIKKLHHNIDPRWTGKQIPYTAARGAGGMP
jgi:hypothetical protein